MTSVEFPEEYFDKLLAYLGAGGKEHFKLFGKSAGLSVSTKEDALTEGRSFFTNIKKESILTLIAALENREYDAVWHLLENDLRFAVAIANSAKAFPDAAQRDNRKVA